MPKILSVSSEDEDEFEHEETSAVGGAQQKLLDDDLPDLSMEVEETILIDSSTDSEAAESSDEFHQETSAIDLFMNSLSHMVSNMTRDKSDRTLHVGDANNLSNEQCSPVQSRQDENEECHPAVKVKMEKMSTNAEICRQSDTAQFQPWGATESLYTVSTSPAFIKQDQESMNEVPDNHDCLQDSFQFPNHLDSESYKPFINVENEAPRPVYMVMSANNVQDTEMSDQKDIIFPNEKKMVVHVVKETVMPATERAAMSTIAAKNFVISTDKAVALLKKESMNEVPDNHDCLQDSFQLPNHLGSQSYEPLIGVENEAPHPVYMVVSAKSMLGEMADMEMPDVKAQKEIMLPSEKETAAVKETVMPAAKRMGRSVAVKSTGRSAAAAKKAVISTNKAKALLKKVKQTNYSLKINTVNCCLVCYAPCVYTQNRKIPSKPFCRKCMGAYFYHRIHTYNTDNVHISKYCPHGGYCSIDRRQSKNCHQCQHTKFFAVLKAVQKVFKEPSMRTRNKTSDYQEQEFTTIGERALMRKAIFCQPLVMLERLDEEALSSLSLPSGRKNFSGFIQKSPCLKNPDELNISNRLRTSNGVTDGSSTFPMRKNFLQRRPVRNRPHFNAQLNCGENPQFERNCKLPKAATVEKLSPAEYSKNNSSASDSLLNKSGAHKRGKLRKHIGTGGMPSKTVNVAKLSEDSWNVTESCLIQKSPCLKNPDELNTRNCSRTSNGVTDGKTPVRKNFLQRRPVRNRPDFNAQLNCDENPQFEQNCEVPNAATVEKLLPTGYCNNNSSASVTRNKSLLGNSEVLKRGRLQHWRKVKESGVRKRARPQYWRKVKEGGVAGDLGCTTEAQPDTPNFQAQTNLARNTVQVQEQLTNFLHQNNVSKTFMMNDCKTRTFHTTNGRPHEHIAVLNQPRKFSHSQRAQPISDTPNITDSCVYDEPESSKHGQHNSLHAGRLSTKERTIRVATFTCGHFCSECNSTEDTKLLEDHGFSMKIPLPFVKNHEQQIMQSGSSPNNAQIMQKMYEINQLLGQSHSFILPNSDPLQFKAVSEERMTTPTPNSLMCQNLSAYMCQPFLLVTPPQINMLQSPQPPLNSTASPAKSSLHLQKPARNSRKK